MEPKGPDVTVLDQESLETVFPNNPFKIVNYFMLFLSFKEPSSVVTPLGQQQKHSREVQALIVDFGHQDI